MTRWRWFLLLPVAVVLVVVSSASRLQIFWWPYELREETVGRQGEPVEVVDDWIDDDGDHHDRELTVTLVDVVPATRVETYSGRAGVHPLPGTAVWEIVLEFHLDPDVPLGGCNVSLIDSRGRESFARGGIVREVSLPLTSCAPAGKPGPSYDGSILDGTEPRPDRYQVSVYAITAEDVEPESVRVWWEPPDYTELSLGS